MTTNGPVSTKTRGTTFVYTVPMPNTNTTTDEQQMFTVCVSNCLTKMINVTPVYEKTGADMLAREVEIRFSGIAHGFGSGDDFRRRTEDQADGGSWNIGNYATGVSTFGYSQFGVLEDYDEAEKGHSTTGNNFGDRMLGNLETVLNALSTPRGNLQFSIGDTIIYNVVSRKDTLNDTAEMYLQDTAYTGFAIDQTPKLECQVVKVISDTSAHIEVTAKFVYQNCYGAEYARMIDNKDVKSLRWWYADDIDGATWGTRRLLRGRIELYDRDRLNALTLRSLVLPPIEWGFRREHISIREQEDGLAADFEVIDAEAYAHPPYPASNWEGQTRVTFGPQLVGAVDISSQIMLEAPIPREMEVWSGGRALFPTKEHLIHLLIRMLDAKLHWHRQVAGGHVFTKQLNISESMKHNRVEASLGLSVVVEEENLRSTQDNHGVSNFRKLVRAVFSNDMSYSANREIGYPEPGTMPLGPGDWGATNAAYSLGHKNGIRHYDRRKASYWQPHDGTLRGILRCALQDPCMDRSKDGSQSGLLNKFGSADRSQVPQNQNEEQIANHGQNTDQGAKKQRDYRGQYDYIVDPGGPADGTGDSVYRSATNDGILSKLQTDNINPYFKYDLTTNYRIDNGMSTFPSKGPVVGVPNGATGNGRLATTVAHYTRGSTAEVVIEVNASRVDAWPVTPTDQSWIDPVTGIMYMCKDLQVVASSVELDATGNHRMFNCGSRVTYVLSRAPKWFEDIRISSAPFIVSAGSQSHAVQQQIENYVGSLSRKSGARYTPTNNNGGESPFGQG
jgi:hypothetical protein